MNQDKPKTDILLSTMSVGMLDNIISCVFTANTDLTLFRKIGQLFDLFPLNELNDVSPDHFIRTYIIQKAVSAKILTKTTDPSILVSAVYSGFGSDGGAIYEVLNRIRPLPSEELEFIERYVSSRLKFNVLFSHSKSIQENLIRLQTGDYMDLDALCDNRIEPEITSLMMKLREVKSVTHRQDFDLSTESLETAIYQAKQQLRENSVIKVGVKALNALYSNREGFETQRCYITLGLPGMWKSGLLLELVLMAHAYNPTMATKDPTKKPAILYISSENIFSETVERLLSNKVGDDSVLHKIETVELVKALQQHCGLTNSDVQVFFKFRGFKEINVLDVYDMYQQAFDAGYEVKLIVQDYLNRMDSLEKEPDERQRIIAIGNECKNACVELDVAWVTASQLNRSAMEKIDELVRQGVADPFKHLSSSQIGEAWGLNTIFDHIDILIPQTVKDAQNNILEYVCFKNVKHRGKLHQWMQHSSEFIHPKVVGNSMRLYHDINDETSASFLTMGPGFVKDTKTNGNSTNGNSTSEDKKEKAMTKKKMQEFLERNL